MKETFGSMEETVAFWDVPIVLQILPYRIDIVNDLINAHFWINASYLINSPLYAVGIVLDTRLQVSQVPQARQVINAPCLEDALYENFSSQSCLINKALRVLVQFQVKN